MPRFSFSRYVVVSLMIAILHWKSATCHAADSASSNSTTPMFTSEKMPLVTVPPDSVFEKVRERDRDVARQFYKKYIDVGGLTAMASGEVADDALQRTYYLVTHMLAGRPDVLEAM